MTAHDAPSDALAEAITWAETWLSRGASLGADKHVAVLLAVARQHEAIGTPSAEDLKRAIELLRWYAGFGPYDTRDEAAIALASRLEAGAVAPETTEGLKRVCPYVDKPCGRPDCETIGCQWNTGRPLPRAIDTARSLAEAIEHVEQENSVCIGAPTEEGDKYAEELRTVIAAARRWQAIGTAPAPMRGENAGISPDREEVRTEKSDTVDHGAIGVTAGRDRHSALIAEIDGWIDPDAFIVDLTPATALHLLTRCRTALQSTPAAPQTDYDNRTIKAREGDAAPLQQPNKGDYAVLDGILLCILIFFCVIAIVTKLKGSALERWEHTAIGEPKVGIARLFEGVHVFNSAVEIDSKQSAANGVFFLLGKRRHIHADIAHVTPWADRASEVFSVKWWHHQQMLISWIVGLEGGPLPYAIGRRLTGVFIDQPDALFANVTFVRKHIGTQLPTSRIFSPLYETISSTKQFERIEEKSAGKHSEKPCGDDKPPVGMRLVILLLSVLLGAILSVKGWRDIYDNRRVTGIRLVWIGTIAILFGVAIWCLTLFRFTWGWWL